MAREADMKKDRKETGKEQMAEKRNMQARKPGWRFLVCVTFRRSDSPSQNKFLDGLYTCRKTSRRLLMRRVY